VLPSVGDKNSQISLSRRVVLFQGTFRLVYHALTDTKLAQSEMCSFTPPKDWTGASKLKNAVTLIVTL